MPYLLLTKRPTSSGMWPSNNMKRLYMTKYRYECPHCHNGSNLIGNAIARWNETRQRWIMEDLMDLMKCTFCDIEFKDGLEPVEVYGDGKI